MKANTQVVNGPVKPGQEITISLELQAPRDAGKYCAFFRFVYGDNHRFGQKVWCDILVQEAEVEDIIKAIVPPTSVKSNTSVQKSQEERSSLINDSEPSSSQKQIEDFKPLQFEELGNKYEEMQKKLEEDAVIEKDKLKQTISNLMGGLDDPSDLNKSQDADQIEEEMKKISDQQQLAVSQIIPKQEEEEEKMEIIEDKKDEEDLKKSQDLSQEN